jgi:hypothetical protein
MKTIFAIFLLAISGAEAFAPAGNTRFGVSSTALNAETSSEAIQAALKASKEFGPTSKEARFV